MHQHATRWTVKIFLYGGQADRRKVQETSPEVTPTLKKRFIVVARGAAFAVACGIGSLSGWGQTGSMDRSHMCLYVVVAKYRIARLFVVKDNLPYREIPHTKLFIDLFGVVYLFRFTCELWCCCCYCTIHCLQMLLQRVNRVVYGNDLFYLLCVKCTKTAFVGPLHLLRRECRCCRNNFTLP